MKTGAWAATGLALASQCVSAQTTPASAAISPVGPSPSSAIEAVPASAAATPTTSAATRAILAAGTPVIVMMNEEVSSKTCKTGDHFGVTVLHDVVGQGAVVIPAGTLGNGEVTFCTNKGGFGKPGILGISLRAFVLNGKNVLLDGRYREEGGNNNGATAATWFAVGIFSGFITGKAGVIPKGRELRARTGEDLAFEPAKVSPTIAAVSPAQSVGAAAPAVATVVPPDGAQLRGGPKKVQSSILKQN